MGYIELAIILEIHHHHVIIAICLSSYGRIVLSSLMPANQACDGVLIRHQVVSTAR